MSTKNSFNDRLAAEARKRAVRLQALRVAGWTVTEIAARHNITKQRVSQLLKLAREEA